jgi:formylglycine-generating enzyme required for sulfatase activity
MGPRILAFVVLLTLLLVAAAQSAHAERRVVLLIGNGAYGKVGKLENPTRDAAAMEALLRKAGFDTVELKRDLGRDAMRRTLRDFSDSVREADIALVFYAGHGIEVKGENYLIPVDAVLERDIDVEDETVPLARVFQVLEPAKRLRLVILDACRDNPFAPAMKRTIAGRSIGRGLAQVEVTTTDTLLAYAAKAGSVALDGQGGNSPYTRALLKHLTTPGLDVTLALRRVRDEVLKSTGGKQEPFFYGSLGGAEIPLVPAAQSAGAAPPPTAAISIAPPSATAETAGVCREVEGMSSPSMLGVLASQYKGTPAADCIAARLAELKQAEEAQSAAAAKKKAAEETRAKAEADRICANVQSVANLAVLKAMAEHHAGKPAAACIIARIEEVEKQTGPVAPVATAKPLTAAQERALKPGDSFKECADCPEMVVVPAGSFAMGSPPEQQDRELDEGPQHRVTIARPFATGKFEVTFAEWDACVHARRCSHIPGDQGWGRDRRPVMNVSWDDITKEYLPWLCGKTGKTYRLLTEVEWEYAARAGATTRYAFGDTITKGQALYNASKTAAVGSFQPNAFGLYDMHGNVSEWVQDCWNESYNGAPADGSAWTTGDCGLRVLRGGSWFVIPRALRAGNRIKSPSGSRDNWGFRVGRTL